MRKILLLFFCVVAASLQPVFSQVLMTDRGAYENMMKMFEDRNQKFGARIPELFAAPDSASTPELSEAMRFLIAYAPLSDLANLTSEYFKEMAELALRTRTEFSWGKSIPSEVFMHFVLPYRVNNENPDTARAVFLPELQERVKGMSMYDAALEVNHWCHEKVTYRSTDERTSAPLSTVKTAFGRCGEESTLTVAAMRSVGIPARQVYTPRWAHTDDNHAWVEVWIDGKWYFMGACEPDPELNMGWFAVPATRAMMMHTNTFGQYAGPEKTLVRKDLYSKLNLLSNYAPTRNVTLRITDNAGAPLKNINVGFTLYNYAEFYEIAGFSTAEDGCVSLETGYGDLLVWMTDGTGYSWWKLPADVTDTITVVYEDKRNLVDEFINTEGKFIDLDFTPPYAGNVVSPSTDKAELNKKRLKEEDSIRADYESTFPDTIALREKYKTNRYGEVMVNSVLKSRGNYFETETLIGRAEDQEDVAELLSAVSEKDLRDTPFRILYDHLQNAEKYECKNCPDDIKNKYVLNPRIGRELLSPWRSELQNSFSKKEIKAFRKDPEKLKNWVLENIAIDSENNYYGVTLFPASVMKLRVADEYSRNVFFVACCRSFGIPARLEPATYAPEYYSNNQWISAFPGESDPDQVKGQLVLTNKNSFDPVYNTHYTIAVLRNGRFITLDYETDQSLRTIPCTLNLEPGTYRLMTGNRQDDGSVLTRWAFFKIEAGKSTEQAITFNENVRKPAKLFTLDMQSELSSLSSDDIKLSSFATGEKGVVIALVDPQTEPGRHFLAEMQPVAGDFDKWGGSVLLVLPRDFNKSDFSATSWKGLPMRCSWMYDETGSLENEIRAKTCTKSVLPEVMYVNNLGEVYYLSRGYQVNTAHILLKTISQSESK